MQNKSRRRQRSVIDGPVACAIERLEARLFLSLSTIGGEFLVNTFTTSEQSSPAIAADADGDFVVAWVSYAQDGSNYGIFAQRYNAAGVAQGNEFRVNTYTNGSQRFVAVAMDADGDFVIAWDSPNQDGSATGIYARRFNPTGLAQGAEFRVNSYTTGEQLLPAVAMNAVGDFVVAWEGEGSGDTYGIFAQRYNSAGTAQGGQFLVNTYTTSSQRSHSIALDADGDFVITWSGYGTGDTSGVFAQRFNAMGVAQGGEFRVNTHTTGNQAAPAIGMDAGGDFVISWTGNYDVFAQRYNAAGVAQGSEFGVNTYTSGPQSGVAMAMDADGDFLISWTDGFFSSQDGSGFAVYAQSFNAAGAAQGGEFRVNTYTTDSQYSPATTMDAEGNAIVAWQSTGQDGSANGVYAQRYNEANPDTAAPVVGGVFVNTRRVMPYQVYAAPMNQIVVSFSENLLNTGPAGANSVTNPANWRLTRNGADIVSDISSISFGFNANTNRYEATLHISGSYTNGNFNVMMGDGIRDVAGNRLDGDLDGAALGTMSVPFSLGTTAVLGGEFRVNSYTTGTQRNPQLASDAAGNFVVAWQSQSPAGFDIYARRFNAAGLALGTEFRVNTYTNVDQTVPMIAMDADGDFVIVWDSFLQNGISSVNDIYGQRFNSAGVPQGGEFLVNTYTTNVQERPDVSMDASGNFMVVWTGASPGGGGVFARRYTAAGVPMSAEFQVNTSAGGSSPSVGISSTGDHVVAWRGLDGSDSGVFAQRYSAGGAAQGGEFRVNTYTTNFQSDPHVDVDDAGNFAVAWTSVGQDGSSLGAYAQRYNALGVAQGGEFRVNTHTASVQAAFDLAMDAVGNFVVAWRSLNQDGSGYGVYAQRYSPAGASQGLEFRVNTTTALAQNTPGVAMDPAGNIIIAWESDGQDGDAFGIYAQRYGIDAPPSVVAVVDGQDPIAPGDLLPLTATIDNPAVISVEFYRESNGVAGLQTGEGGDQLVGFDNSSAGGWSVMASTVGVSAGTHLYYAQATGSGGLSGTPATTTNTISAPPGPQVTTAGFAFDTAPRKLTFTFNGDASVGLGVEDILLEKIGGGSVPGLTMLPYGTDGVNVASFTMNTQLADGNYRATVQGVGGANVLNFFILGGDANHDRKVDARDLLILANNWFGSGKTWSQGDFNGDGLVNQIDLTVMAQGWQQNLAQPAPALPAVPVAARPPTRAPMRTPVRPILLI